MKRENGFYWAKYFNEWIVVRYDLNFEIFYMAGVEAVCYEQEFEEIDPTPITR